MKLPELLSPLVQESWLRGTNLPKSTRLASGAPDGLIVLRAGTTTLADAVAQIPASPPVTRLFVHPDEAREDGVLARFRPRGKVARATRASALLACGYRDIGAAELLGIDWVWGTPLT